MQVDIALFLSGGLNTLRYLSNYPGLFQPTIYRTLNTVAVDAGTLAPSFMNIKGMSGLVGLDFHGPVPNDHSQLNNVILSRTTVIILLYIN